jgi:hypothetical protein
MQEWSPRTRKYVEAMIRQGEEFNIADWLRDVREEERREKTGSATENAGQEMKEEPARTSAAQAFPWAEIMCHELASVARAAVPVPVPNSVSRHDKIRARLQHVTDAWHTFQRDRSRGAAYPYLRAVYTIVVRYQRRRQIKRLMRVACEKAKIEVKAKTDPFITIIRCTCANGLDSKAISKMARALRFAAYKKCKPRRVIAFLRSAGGISACAGEYAKLRSRGTAI